MTVRPHARHFRGTNISDSLALLQAWTPPSPGVLKCRTSLSSNRRTLAPSLIKVKKCIKLRSTTSAMKLYMPGVKIISTFSFKLYFFVVGVLSFAWAIHCFLHGCMHVVCLGLCCTYMLLISVPQLLSLLCVGQVSTAS